MEREAAVARYAELHDKAKFHDGTFTTWGAIRSLETPYQYGEGASIIATAKDLGLGGDFLKSAAERLDDEFDEDD
jgi:hypothetical protein